VCVIQNDVMLTSLIDRLGAADSINCRRRSNHW